jgi:hypothetical protein
LESANTALRNVVLALQYKDDSQDDAVTSLQAKLKDIVIPESFQASGPDAGIPSDAAEHLVVKLDVPAGLYVVIVKGSAVITPDENKFGGRFSLWAGGTLVDGSYDEGNIGLLSEVRMANGGTISVTCRTIQDGFEVHEFKLIAIKVGSLH